MKTSFAVPGLLVLTLTLAAACTDDGAVGDASSGSSETGETDTDTGETDTDTGETDTDTGPAGPPGEFAFLTYNVAGLPQGISSSNPEVNIPLISPLLNDFDVVVVQEDFWYHPQLAADADHPHHSAPYSDEPALDDMGDGLNRFSQYPFELHERVPWYSCNGNLDCASDCLATKGWSFARMTLAEGVELDVYNLHMEAGGCPEDVEIREQAAMDLVAGIAERSQGRAVVVAGDYNLRITDPEDVGPLETIEDGAGLTDACEVLACGDARIDHVKFRGSAELELSALEWWIPQEFIHPESQEELSDHLPVAVTFRYEPK